MNEVAIEFQNVSKNLGGKLVLENVTFSVLRNDIFGYLGPNGAGKTTSIRLILGLLKPSQGSVLVCGYPPTNKNARRMVGFVLDHDGLYLSLSAKENLELFDRIYNKAPGRKKRIEEALLNMELENVANQPVWTFSKGMKKRLSIARALLANPKILVLDEPTSGLDPQGQLKIRELLLNLSKDMTVFLSSHNLTEVQRLCNRLAIINKTLHAYGPIEDLLSKEGTAIALRLRGDGDYTKVTQIIARLPGVERVIRNTETMELFLRPETDAKETLRLLLAEGVEVIEFKNIRSSLEEFYFSVTGGKVND